MSPVMESLSPKPVSIRAVHPAIPITVIKKRFLYRKIFLAVTFSMNPILFHIKGIFSRRTRFPILGALGRKSIAGVALREARIANNAEIAVQITAVSKVIHARSMRNGG